MFITWGKKAMSVSSKNRTEYEISRARRRFAIIFLAAVVVTAGTISFIITKQAVDNMRSKIVNLISSNNQQLEYNVDNYLMGIEDTVALFFAEDQLCEYDVTDDSLDEFTRIQQEAAIQDRISDLGVFDNFTDFGVVYSNDKSVGWLSNTTLQSFPDGGIYTYFVGHLSDERTKSGWFFDYNRSPDRLFYVKQLNENAVIVTSFYSRELGSVINLSQDMKDMRVCLINDSDEVMYSNNAKYVGEKIKVNLSKAADDSGYQTMSEGYVISMAHCSNGWRVVSYISESKIFKEVERLILYSFVATLILALFVVVTGSIVLKRIYNPVSGVIEELKKKAEHDQLTGLMNKVSFGEVVGTYLESKSETVIHVFVMMDMDNFKKVNDTLGHGEGDVVLAKSAKLFTRMLGADSVIGRVGGDEFAVYRKFTGWTLDNVRKKVDFELKLLNENFDINVAGKYSDCKLSLSAGVYAVYGENADDYDSMMKKADIALYNSKRNGKGQYSWFVEN